MNHIPGIPPQFIHDLDFFVSNYDFIDGSWLDSKRQIGREGRVCRFCGKADGEVNFKLIPHAFPEFIGNSKWTSWDECDTCNNGFGGTIETDLANYLGLERILGGMKGKAGLPKEKLERGSIQKGKNTGLVEVCAMPESVEHDKEEKTLKFKKKRAPYVPAGIFKCLMKMALSVMPDKYLDEFLRARRWVSAQHNNWDFVPESFLYAVKIKFLVSETYPSVGYQIFRRKKGSFGCPYMLFQVCFGRFSFQIPLYRDAVNIQFYGARDLVLRVPVVPVFSPAGMLGSAMNEIEVLPLRVTDKRRDDEQVVIMKYSSGIQLDLKGVPLVKGHVDCSVEDVYAAAKSASD